MNAGPDTHGPVTHKVLKVLMVSSAQRVKSVMGQSHKGLWVSNAQRVKSAMGQSHTKG